MKNEGRNAAGIDQLLGYCELLLVFCVRAFTVCVNVHASDEIHG